MNPGTPRVALLALALSACAVGPNYHRPATPVADAFKENKGWTPATPGQVPTDQPWWSIYNDPVLDGLEKQVVVSNQTLKAAEAAYRAAQAAVGVDRGSYFPDITATGAATRTNQASATSNSGAPHTIFSVQPQLSWSIDVWGRIRRTVESDVSKAQANAADVAAALLSAQVTLAEDYFQLRAADEQRRLYKTSIAAFQTSLTISQNRVKAGVTTLADVYSAETELESTQALDISVLLTRAKLEHAIAVLVGKNPEDLGIDDGPLTTTIPVVPPGVPSELLQRRPDISASERSMASANALIGVAESAWFPSVSLSGSVDFASQTLGGLFQAGTAVWSVGPSLAQTVFNGGATLYQTREARANYEQTVATYRGTVLTAFQQVEDDLSGLRVLEQQQTLQQTAVLNARRSEALTLNQYKQGITDYATLLVAQTTRLAAEIALLSIQSQRLVTSVDLIGSLGGGWSAARLEQRDRGVPPN
jgi:NodT family efflux transporter outer membrane factor (OMF) lipoprotein